MEKSIIGTGIFNLDIIVVREYPDWPSLRPFVDREVQQEVGGTCGNVMCMIRRVPEIRSPRPSSMPWPMEKRWRNRQGRQ